MWGVIFGAVAVRTTKPLLLITQARASTICVGAAGVGLVVRSLPSSELREVSLDGSLLGIERTVPVGYVEMLASIGR